MSLNDFKKLKELNNAGFRRLWLVEDKQTQQKYAMRLISISDFTQEETQKIMNESLIPQKMNHVNIVRIVNSFQDEQQFIILLEQADHGLDSEISQWKNDKSLISIPKIVKYFKQVLDALSYCHNQKVIHRNIKPQNILMFSSQQANEFIPKLTDFGCATLLTTKNKTVSKVGTINYMAPEIFDGKGYAFPVDIWAMGCVLYEMVTTEQAFPGSNMSRITQNVMQCKIDFSKMQNSEMQQIVTKMLCKDEVQRITIDALLREQPFDNQNSNPNNNANKAKANDNKNNIKSIKFNDDFDNQKNDNVKENKKANEVNMNIFDQNNKYDKKDIYNIIQQKVNQSARNNPQPQPNNNNQANNINNLDNFDNKNIFNNNKADKLASNVKNDSSYKVELKKIVSILIKDGIYLESLAKPKQYLSIKDKDAPDCACWSLQNIRDQEFNIFNVATNTYLSCSDQPREESQIISTSSKQNATWQIIKEADYCFLTINEQYAVEVSGSVKLSLIDKDVLVQQFKIHVILNGVEQQNTVQGAVQQDNEKPVSEPIELRKIEKLEKDGIYIESMGKKNHYICVKQQDLNNLEAASWIIKRFGEQGVTIENTKTKLKLMSPDCPAHQDSEVKVSNEKKNNVWLVVKQKDLNVAVLKLDEGLALESQGRELKIVQYDEGSFVQMFKFHNIENGQESEFKIKLLQQQDDLDKQDKQFDVKEFKPNANVDKKAFMDDIAKVLNKYGIPNQNFMAPNKFMVSKQFANDEHNPNNQDPNASLYFTRTTVQKTENFYIIEYANPKWAMTVEHVHSHQAQLWTLEKTEQNLFNIKNVATGQYLACVDQKVQKYSKLTMSANPTQQFSMKQRSNSGVTIFYQEKFVIGLYSDRYGHVKPGILEFNEQDAGQVFVVVDGIHLMEKYQNQMNMMRNQPMMMGGYMGGGGCMGM